MAMLGSVGLSTPAANITFVFVITLGILAMGGFLHQIAQRMNEPAASILTAIYFIIPHLELFNLSTLITHDWPIAPWIDVLVATLYGFAYMAFFLVAACMVFRRKALN
jgi:membrane protease YdiL (CAAX protease family)